MNKTHLITAIFVTISTGFFGQNQQENDSISSSETLNEVFLSSAIIGSKFEVKNRTGSATYISKKELRQFNYTDINRVLRNVPGVSVYEEDGFGLRPNISLRGTSPERSAKITLMEDGVLIAPAPYSAPAAYYFPTIGRMEAVEILKGSSQIQYGPYTTGGAINMVSRQIPNSFSGNARLSFGNYNTRNTEIGIGDSQENFGYVMEYFNYNSDGFKSLDGGGNTGFDKSDYSGKFRVNTNKDAKVYQALTFKIQYAEEISNETYLGLAQNDFDNNPYRRYVSSSKDRMDTQHEQFQINHLIKPSNNIKINTTAYLNKFSRNWYKLNDVTLSETVGISAILANPQTYPDEYAAVIGTGNTAADVFSVKANNRAYESKGIQSVANFSFGNTIYQDLEIGLRYHEDSEDRFQWADKYALLDGKMVQTTVGIPGTDANRISSAKALAAHALYKVTFNGLTITPGLRYENITLYSDDYGKNDVTRTGVSLNSRENQVDVFIPGIGANYKFNPEISVFGGVHKGFSPPGSQEGAEAEESLNIELGTRFNWNGIQGEVIGFYNNYSNMLGSDLAASGGTGTLDQFNAGAALVKGLELVLNYDALKNNTNLSLPLTVTYTHNDAIFKSDFDSAVGIFGEVESGDEIPYIARNQFNLMAGIENQKMSFTISGRYTDAFRTHAGSGAIPEAYKVGSNFIVDASLRYFYKPGITVFTNVYNLLDTKYEVARLPAGLRPGAPFMINAGMAFSF